MTRISTAGSYQSALLNLMSAQNQQNEAQTRVSTRKIATDMAGFGRGAESLTALKATQSRVQGFLDTGDAVAARMESQDLALNQIGDAITNARAAIGSVLSSDSANVLMLELQGQFQSVQNGLNAQHQGNFLFGGADSTNAPISVHRGGCRLGPAREFGIGRTKLGLRPVADGHDADWLPGQSRQRVRGTAGGFLRTRTRALAACAQCKCQDDRGSRGTRFCAGREFSHDRASDLSGVRGCGSVCSGVEVISDNDDDLAERR